MSPQKCKHQPCTCIPSQGKEYCSQACQDAKSVTELTCDCGHPGCGEKLTAGAASR